MSDQVLPLPSPGPGDHSVITMFEAPPQPEQAAHRVDPARCHTEQRVFIGKRLQIDRKAQGGDLDSRETVVEFPHGRDNQRRRSRTRGQRATSPRRGSPEDRESRHGRGDSSHRRIERQVETRMATASTASPQLSGTLRGPTVQALALFSAEDGTGSAAPPLSARTYREALMSGRALVVDVLKRPVRHSLLYRAADAFTVACGEGGVEAVQFGLPFKRTHRQATFHDAPGKTFTQRPRPGRDGRLEFIIYAHSRGFEDQAFLTRFAFAHLTVEDGRDVHPDRVVLSAVSLNFYRDAHGRMEFRWNGSVRYHFDLRALPAALVGTLSFIDADGRMFRLPFGRTRLRS